MKTVLKTAGTLSPLFLKKVPEASGLRLRFPFSPLADRTLPSIAEKNLFQLYDEVIDGSEGKPVVAVFAGCSITYLYPHLGRAMIETLRYMGYTILLPRTQGCCGIPARSSGHGETIERLAEANKKAFSSPEIDHIVTACATCASGIGDLDETMDDDFSDLTSKVTDILEFLHGQGLGEILRSLPEPTKRTKVTYHDPCHLKSRGVTRQPRELLQSIPGIDYVESSNAAECCGLGGTFSIHHYDCSRAIGNRKLEGLVEAGGDIVATACPGCMMQLQDIMTGAGLKTRAAHVIELIYTALYPEDKA